MPCLSDSYGRPINYLRVSVTDRCNLRCVYCMPAEGVPVRPHEEILRYEEILLIVQAAVELGITKVRVTGGEPLVRAGLVGFIGSLAGIPGLEDISLTTNGILLSRFAPALREAGLRRVNVSLDTLRADKFRQITRLGKLEDVLQGIASAEEAGLHPIKINCVAVKGFNDDEIVDFCRLTLEREWHIRFIEFMPVGQAGQSGAAEEDISCQHHLPDGGLTMASGNESFLPVEEIKREAGRVGELVPCGAVGGGGPAKYYRFPGAPGTIGFISPVTDHFCFSCNRLRLTADGRLRPCLLSEAEISLREAIRGGATLEEVKGIVARAAWEKPHRHNLEKNGSTKGRTMAQIGG